MTTGIAVLALATVVGAQAYTFSTNLTIGSTGPDVVALQTALIAGGYSIPSIQSGAASKGYFGAQTEAAVQAYQTAHGIPSTGFVGPLTRGSLNSGVATTMSSSGTSSTCPVGYTCTATAPVSTQTCPVGYTCTANTGTTGTVTTGTVTAPTGITTPGISGTLSVSSSGSIGVGATVNPGQSVDIAGFKLQAGPSDMQVNTITADFSVRPWLFFTDFSLVNQTTGQVLVPATPISQSNFTEITASQDYRYTLSGLNFVVPHGQTVNVVLHGDTVSSTGQSAQFINIIAASVRSVDGTGVVDTENLTSTTCTSGNSSASACGSVYFGATLKANLIFSIDSSSPLAQVIQTQTGATTNSIPLAIYDVQAQNSAATLQSLVMNIGVNGTVNAAPATPTAVYSTIQLTAGGLTYYGTVANTSGESGTVTFTNMNIPLALLQNVPLKIVGSVVSGINAVTSTTSIATATAGIVGGVDTSFNTPTVQGNGTIVSSVITYSTNSAITIAPGAVTAGASTVQNNSTVAQQYTYTFTVSAGASSLYLSANPAWAVATSTSPFVQGTASASTTAMTQVLAVGNSLSGDTNTGVGTSASGSYVIPSNSSRTFTVSGTISNATNATNVSGAILAINGIYYSTSPTITSNTGASMAEYQSGLTSLQNVPINLSH